MHAEEIGGQLAEEGYSLQVLQQGEEPENFFWVGIGGEKEICDVSVSSFISGCFVCTHSIHLPIRIFF